MRRRALIISATCPAGQETAGTLELPRDHVAGMYTHGSELGRGERNFRPGDFAALIPAGQEIANKILASAREINPSHATVEASLRIMAQRPPLKITTRWDDSRVRRLNRACPRDIPPSHAIAQRQARE